MDYHHPFHSDYYVVKYALYESTQGYFETFDNDEICRNEIFDHLTLTFLQNKKYLEKARADRDLAGIQNFIRFRRLMDNILTGSGTEIYGIWYEPENVMKASYLMLDGRMMQIRPDNRPKTSLFFDFYRSKYAESRYREYTFKERETGYECFDPLGGGGLTMQWEYKNSQFTLFVQMNIKDLYKLGVAQASSPDKDYKYFTYNIAVEDPDFRYLFFDDEIRLVSMKHEPYHYVLTGDDETFKTYIKNHVTFDATIAATISLIAGNGNLLDWLLKNAKVSQDELLLRSCVFDHDLFYKFEQGIYGFQFDDFLGKRGLDIFRYAAASGDVSFFKLLYNNYYEIVYSFAGTDDIVIFKRDIIQWPSGVANKEMEDICFAIFEGKYNAKQ
jgi:hypothetical protein